MASIKKAYTFKVRNPGKVSVITNDQSNPAYRFTALKPESTGASMLAYIAKHPGATTAEVTAGTGTENMDGFYAALQSSDLAAKTKARDGNRTWKLNKKGLQLVEDIFSR